MADSPVHVPEGALEGMRKWLEGAGPGLEFGLDRAKVPHRFSPEYVPQPGPVDREEAFGLIAKIVGLPNASMTQVIKHVQLLANAVKAPT